MTLPVIRMTFGLQVPAGSGPMTLTVTGSIGTPPPPLTARSRDAGKTFDASWNAGSWTMPLAPDDYVVTIEAPIWVAGLLDIAVTKAPGDDDPVFVYYGYLADLQARGLAAWRTTATVVDPPASSVTDDPKDPVPPPPPPPSRVELPTPSATWFEAQMVPDWEFIQGQLAHGGGRRSRNLG